MGVNRTDYLMWGTKVSPDQVQEKYDDLEAEIDGDEGRRFDLVYDGMSGKYAVAGKILAVSDRYGDIGFHEVGPDCAAWRPDVVAAVRKVFDTKEMFALYLFSHYH